MNRLTTRLSEARARQALRASGLPYRTRLERASSTNNEIYLSDRYVVRINTRPDQRLRREASLYPHFPHLSWTPAMVAVGGETGADYLIIERKPGVPLAHYWPRLSTEKRRQAIASLADHLRTIHAIPTPDGIAPIEVPPQLIEAGAAPPVRPLLEGIDRLATDPRADQGVISDARDYVISTWPTLDGFDDGHLIHGDLTFENMLWDGRSVSAIIDFEWCRGAPADVDLDVLLRCCALPEAHVAASHQDRTQAEDYADVAYWLAEEYPALFSHANLTERLMLYALSFEVRLATMGPIPANRPDDPMGHPYNRLIGLLSSGGHVVQALHRAGISV
jgi:aminoglycoside phosphotransferase (APT) family kinase protein